MDNWVTPNVTGGLGNRLFQIAAVLGAAEKWQVPIIFVTKFIWGNEHGDPLTIRRFFPSIEIFHDDREWYDCSGEINHYEYQPLPDNLPFHLTVVSGLRQTEKYFPTTGIRPQWNFLVPLEVQKSLVDKYRPTSSSWFLHRRLGDYKTEKNLNLDLKIFYGRAMDQIPKGSHLLFFTDELELCEDWIREETILRNLNLEIVYESDEVNSLWLMSQCKGGAIVPNSTFSWWGAYFAHQNAPATFRALYPDRWGNIAPPAIDIIPTWGTRISTR
jgi:hypothetical protein